MDYIIALCLICMLGMTIAFFVKASIYDKAKRLIYLKNFKKGRFALIYIAALPLFWMAIVYNGVPVGGALLLAVKSCVDLVVLKFDYNSVAALMSDNLFFCVTMYICFALSAINAIILAFTLFGQKTINSYRKWKAAHISKKTYVVVGYSSKNLQIMKSLVKQKSSVILLSNVGADVRDIMFVEKIAYVNHFPKDDLSDILVNIFGKFTNKSVILIINTDDDSENIVLVEQLSRLILQQQVNNDGSDDFGLKGYAFGESENASPFIHFVEKTKGRITYVNKYKLIAMNFIENYPLTKFMTEEHIDFEKATIKENVNLNVVMIGFGNTNQEIFLTSIASNQFLTTSGEALIPKPVNYWIYDKKDSENDKNLNHNYYRFSHECEMMKGREDEYLPLPESPANEVFYKLNINDNEFYSSIKENISCHTENAYNYIIIAFGADMENIDLAEKIIVKLKEWEIKSKTKVFVKVRNASLAENVFDKENANNDGFITFGNEKRIVYNINQIADEKIEKMALMRHLTYMCEYYPDDSLDKIKVAATKEWYEVFQQVQRVSNVYGCLSIRLKLNLLGFDYCAKNDERKDASALFIEKYTKGCRIDYSEQMINGKNVIRYKNSDFDIPCLRTTYAVHEHQRWISYMICCGFVPSTIKEIKADNKGKRFDLRKHGNLTTFEGLKEFRDIVSQYYGKTLEQADVIRYDYQLMDDVAWLLSNCGYKIIKK